MIVEYKSSLGILRDDMPQVSSRVSAHFASYLTSLGWEVLITRENPFNIKNTQSSYNQKRVDKKLEEVESKGIRTLLKPLIVSSEGYLLDGHHTVEALRQWIDSNETTVESPIFKTNVPIQTLLDYAHQYEYGHKKSINDID